MIIHSFVSNLKKLLKMH